jgi:hypothetical protein
MELKKCVWGRGGGGVLTPHFLRGYAPACKYPEFGLHFPDTSWSVCHLFCMRYVEEMEWEEAQVK